MEEKTGTDFIIWLTMQFIEGSESDRVQRNGSRISVLRFGQMDLPTLEVDLALLQAVLLAHPHPSMDGQRM